MKFRLVTTESCVRLYVCDYLAGGDKGTMLNNCILILPVSDPAKQAAQVVKHHVFGERTVIT
jgi:hypothetical protein